MDDHKLLHAEVAFDDALQPLPASEEGSAEVGIVHRGLRCVQMIGSSAQQIVYNHP
jgi:hypothetical protein